MPYQSPDGVLFIHKCDAVMHILDTKPLVRENCLKFTPSTLAWFNAAYKDGRLRRNTFFDEWLTTVLNQAGYTIVALESCDASKVAAAADRYVTKG